ncbi:MAG: UDP-N-acetylmuramoyl-L-alanyl-D-glutamate--2,6-diaminopimelate ligase, partial [Gammaproteobacteria bacterium]|nr:UDP-N-acetylmuramoyl-L-alanyl-D-glutamate--2,6-diaminopimelate ligase [Gammaproteobacteria bacterium]
MPEKALNRLLADFTVIEERHQDILACGLTLSSAEVEPGYVFFACQGANRHGIDYAKQAVERGAVAIVVEHVRGIEAKLAQIHIPTILVEDLTRHLSEIAARFFDHPSKKLEVIGVTGTNGKTSVAQFIAHTLTGWGGRCAVLGTLGNGLWGQLSPATHTTSDAITTQRHIYEALFNGAQYVVMEVSSHALDQHRVAAVDFDIAVFTNLTRDHLDYHGTMESYSEAKKKLFLMESVKCAIINGDDAFGVQLAQSLVNTKQILNYTVAGASEKIESNVIMLLLERLHVNGMSVRVTFNGKSVTFDCELLGRFNVSNLAAVIGVLLAKDIALSDLPALFSGIKAPKGRMEKFGGVNQKPLVVVDYAHTPDAIRQ